MAKLWPLKFRLHDQVPVVVDLALEPSLDLSEVAKSVHSVSDDIMDQLQ